MEKSIPRKLYYKISEVSEIAGLEPSILRYWENEFKGIRPKRTETNQRLYRRQDLDKILQLKKLLYEERFTIAGAKKRLGELSREAKKQLELDFSEGKYRKALKEIRQELKQIKNLLE